MYIRIDWKDNETKVNARNMNHIEDAIEDLYNEINGLEEISITTENIDQIIEEKGFATISELDELINSKNLVNQDEVEEIIEEKGYITETRVNEIIDSKNFVKAEELVDTLSLLGYVTETDVDSKGYTTTANVNTIIESKGYINSTQANTLIEGKGYTTVEEVNQMIADSITTVLNTEV